MPYLIIATVMVVTASFVVFTAVPWLAKRFAVYRFHEIRETLYALGDCVPGAKGTIAYRELEFLVTQSIVILREGGVRDALVLLHVSLPKRSDESAGTSTNEGGGWPADEMDRVFGSLEHREALLRVLKEISESHVPIFWRVIWSHPACFVAAVALSIWSIPAMLQAKSKENDPKRQIVTLKARAERVRRAEHLRFAHAV